MSSPALTPNELYDLASATAQQHPPGTAPGFDIVIGLTLPDQTELGGRLNRNMVRWS